LGDVLAFVAAKLLASWTLDLTEQAAVNKPRKLPARALGEISSRCVADVFTRQGFTSIELVTQWQDIVGSEIAAHTEPIKIQWSHHADAAEREPGVLVVRAQGPTALEVQHLSNVILERVNSFLGWRAVGRLAIRQAPLTRTSRTIRPPSPNAETVRRLQATLTSIADDELRAALARLGATIKSN
jgi:hypothetical protein